MARPRQADSVNSDPQGVDYTDTTFDSLGRVATVSNPTAAAPTSPHPPETTTYGYDALDRKTSETYRTTPSEAAYCGPSTLVTDPTNRWRRSRIDGLGVSSKWTSQRVGASVASTGCPGSGEPI